MKQFDRRSILAGTAGALALGQALPLRAAVLVTPAQSEGPFYPRPQDMPDDRDNDLVRIAGAVREAGGTILHLSGTVTDRNGAILPSALIEIWQCDVNGRYIHGRDWSLRRARDEYFQGYGKTLTDGQGRYLFRTIEPVPYTGRTPHIHVKVHDPRSGAVLTTQMYVAGQSQNAEDGLYRRMTPVQQNAVTVALRPRGDGELDGFFTIVL